MGGISLSGMASGLDTNSIISQLMALERNKIAKQNLRGKGIEAEAGGLRDVQSKLRALKSASEGLRSVGLWADKQTVESSNPARLAVERTSMAPAGGHSMWARQLASAEQEGFTYTPSTSATELTVGGKTVAIPANATSADIASLINGTADLAVYATAVDGDTLVFSGRQTGSAGAFDVASTQLVADASLTTAAKDAEYSLDAGATWKTSSSNVLTEAIVGLKITLKGTTPSAETINVGVAGVDTAAVKEKLKAFVTAYNDVITATRAKVDEKGVRDPQTAADAAKGRLFGDTGLSGVLSRLRSVMSDAVAGITDTAMDQLLEIGISTGKSTSEGTTSGDSKLGKLVIDDVKLDAALADATKVRELLGAGGKPGFAQKIEALLEAEAGTSGVLSERLKINSDEQRRVKDRIADIEERIATQEKRLRVQFTAMEKALSMSQSQGNWLMGQISAMQR
jgi:flagellar hook-associated protein 2